MSERTIRLHIFCSVKGGVGKSTLATVTAKLLAARGRVTALVDCDMSGTSIGDGLRLCAPYVTCEEGGVIDLLAPPTGRFYTVEESRARRAERRTAMQLEDFWKDRPHPPPYLNDALTYAYAAAKLELEKRAARMDAMAWRHEREDGIKYFPSSSTYDDVVATISWFLEEPFDFARALVVSLDALAKEEPTLSDVVLDLPPGIWGFPHEALFIAHHLLTGKPLPEGFPAWHEGGTRWEPNPFLVTSQDPNDYVPALEYIALHKDKVPNLEPIVNRASEGLDVIRREAQRRLGPLLGHAGLDEKLKLVGHTSVLARLFRDGDLEINKIPESVFETLRLEDI